MEQREFDKYFDKMVNIIETNSSGQERFAAQINSLTEKILNLIKDTEDTEKILSEISIKMKTTSNEQLNAELIKLKETNDKIQVLSMQISTQVKEIHDNKIDETIKEKLIEALNKVNSLDGKIESKIGSIEKKIEAYNDKEKRIEIILKLAGALIGLFMILFSAFMTMKQDNSMEKIEKLLQDKNKIVEIKK